MERWQLELAESNLRWAQECYDRWGGIERVGTLMKARRDLFWARQEWQQIELAALRVICAVTEEHIANLIYRPFLAQAKQSNATFLAREAAFAESEAALGEDGRDGWNWPVRVMEAGLSHALVEGLEGRETYFGAEVLPQVAKAVNGARFRRRHPTPAEGAGFDLPELTCGWMSDGRVEGQAVYATAHLLHSEGGIRAKLMAAREAGKLDLYGVSVMASFNYRGKEIGGKIAPVATNLVRFVALDMVAEPGAGGRFLAA